MSKLLYLGMPWPEVVRATTATPARLLGLAGEIGTLRPGAVADVATFVIDEGPQEFQDVYGNRRTGHQLVRNVQTWRAGRLMTPKAVPPPPPWIELLPEDAMSSGSPLHGQVALITGAGSGIGAALASQLAEAGMAVLLVGRRPGPLAEQVAAITARGGRAAACPADVRDFAAVDAAVAQAVSTFGRLDVLVANAAIADFGPVESADPALWDDVIRTNVLGVLYAVRATMPHLTAQGSGHIVIVSSASGRETYVGEPAYIASKHATVAFADSLRKEVTPQGIRVTVIEPGLVETPLIHVYPEADALVPDVVPLDPAEVATIIRFALERPAERRPLRDRRAAHEPGPVTEWPRPAPSEEVLLPS